MDSHDDAPPLPPVSELFPYLYSNPATLPGSADPFTITTKTGFLPVYNPRTSLPDVFKPFEALIEDFPIVKADGSPGLLAKFQLGPIIDGGALPDLTAQVDALIAEDGKPDLSAITAVFRDYSFLASAYLLEPCWEKWSKDHEAGYGLGRQVLPKEIAGPLVKTAEILDIPPFMSYAASYALYNYRLADPSLGTGAYSNLRLIRAFEHGLDPTSSEAGFILTHVHMVSHTPALITGAMSLLSTIATDPTNTPLAIHAMEQILSAMTSIDTAMESMWTHSLPRDYISYRTFIFGITSQSMFPRGVVYAGQFADAPQSFRGESGANDSIVPLLDHLCQIPMPPNPLTTILRDFRRYRPAPHRRFLAYVESRATELRVRDYLTRRGPDLAVRYLRLLDAVRAFRWRHWLFAREYIIRRSGHPTATGGSPIVTWLPNQLGAVMEMMRSVWVESGLEALVAREEGGAGGMGLRGLREMMDLVEEQRGKLDREVKRYCQERGA